MDLPPNEPCLVSLLSLAVPSPVCPVSVASGSVGHTVRPPPNVSACTPSVAAAQPVLGPRTHPPALDKLLNPRQMDTPLTVVQHRQRRLNRRTRRTRLQQLFQLRTGLVVLSAAGPRPAEAGRSPRAGYRRHGRGSSCFCFSTSTQSQPRLTDCSPPSACCSDLAADQPTSQLVPTTPVGGRRPVRRPYPNPFLVRVRVQPGSATILRRRIAQLLAFVRAFDRKLDWREVGF